MTALCWQNNAYPREVDPRDLRFRGRIRVQLKDDGGTPVNELFPSSESKLNIYCLQYYIARG